MIQASSVSRKGVTMTFNSDRIGALIFLIFSLAYGYSASLIPSLPGEGLEPLTPRTFPYALAVVGAAFSLLLLLKSGITHETRTLGLMKAYDWKLTLSLLVLMLIYGWLLSPLGFLVATLLFLIAGFVLMGERRPKVLLLSSVPLVIIFWLLLAKVLGVYLEPGTVWE